MYERPRPQPGGCGETWLLTRVAFQLLAPGLIAIAAVLLLVMFFFAALATHPALALVPVGILALMLFGIWFWDRRRGERRFGPGGDAGGEGRSGPRGGR